MIWNEKIETMDGDELRALQSSRLKNLVLYTYENSPFYKRKFDKLGVKPDDIQSISDIDKLPFTTKIDMRDNYPWGMFSRSRDEIIEVHVSSGTTGNPTVVGYTSDDIKLWSEVMARALCCGGAKPEDIIQIAYGYGLFTGGLGFHYGSLEMGLTTIPASSGQTQRQLKIMQDFRPRILACTPSYALYMAEQAREQGIEPRSSSWEVGIFGAEPWSDSIRKEIEETWNIIATDVYGLSEIIGPGVAQECQEKRGLHIFSDVFYPEVVDPVMGTPVDEGGDGELVITTLTKQGLPLIRYRTRDIISINQEKCSCGRTSPRISKIKGRTDDMIVVKGINVFPSQIEEVLLGIEHTQPHYQIIVDRKKTGMDDITVKVEVEQELFSDEVRKLNQLEQKIRNGIESILSIRVGVQLVEPKSIERSAGKSKRVVDLRKM